jgi:DNA-binding MarR family transcriptional regulator
MSARDELIAAINLEVRRSQNRADAYDEFVADQVGLNRTDQRALDVLDQEGGTITPGRLAERMGLTSGAITTVLDRLERAGFVRRVRDEEDRRRIHVEVTDLVRDTLWPYYEPMAELGERLFSRYSDQQLELLLDFLVTSGELNDRLVARLKKG